MFITAVMDSLVNKTNLVYNLLAYLSISTCFRRLWAHHQGKQLCFCNTWYFLFCMDDCLVCRVPLHTRQSSIQNKKYQVLQKHSCFPWWWAHSRLKHVEIDKNELCTKLVLFTRLYRDALSTKHKICCYRVCSILITLFNLQNLHISLMCLRLAIVLLEYGSTGLPLHTSFWVFIFWQWLNCQWGLVESCSIWVIGGHR